MKNKRIRKIIASAIVLSIVLFTAGCGNNIKEKLETGITYLNNGEYDKAEQSFGEIIKEKPDNNEAKVLEQIVKNYKYSEELYKSGDYTKAKEEINKIPSEYSKYNIKENVDKLKEEIDKKLKEIKAIDEKLNCLEKLIKENKLSEANKEIENIKAILTKEQEDKLKNLKIDLKSKEDKIKEEKLKEEKLKEEKIKKEKLEYQKKAQASKESTNKKETKNNQNTSNKTGNIVYKNNELGIQMTLPRSWEGNYRITSNPNGFSVFVKCNQKYENEGYLFSVKKESDISDLSTYDGIGKRYVTAKGVKYVIGGPTGLVMGEDNPKFKLYIKMVRDSYNISHTINPIS
ncbi:MAG: hypothetical protein ACRC1T_02210 [Clostridium chrysemydis]|uniref:hypothetical protein n=1 Tax=Clostridium chrysemydis TaxID=2665504 RepID=UPI003F41528D